MLAAILVIIPPGATALMRMFCLAYSIAIALVIATSPALLAQ